MIRLSTPEWAAIPWWLARPLSYAAHRATCERGKGPQPNGVAWVDESDGRDEDNHDPGYQAPHDLRVGVRGAVRRPGAGGSRHYLRGRVTGEGDREHEAHAGAGVSEGLQSDRPRDGLHDGG